MNRNNLIKVLFEMNQWASKLDWLVHYDEGYWITSTEDSTRGIVICYHKNYRHVMSKIKNTLYNLEICQKRAA